MRISLFLKLFIVLLFSFWGSSYAYSESNAINLRLAIDKNILSPEQNIDLLGQLNAQREPLLIKYLSSDTFVKSNGFKTLSNYINEYTMNSGNLTKSIVNDFSVEGTGIEISVTFEYRANGKWYVKHIFEIINGRSTPLAIEQSHPVYKEALDPLIENGNFGRFAGVWKRLMTGKNNFNLIAHTAQKAIFDNVVFYSGDCKQFDKKNIISIATITLSRFDPGSGRIENGWLITEFSAKELDLNKKSNYIEPESLMPPPTKTPRKLSNIPAITFSNKDLFTGDMKKNDPYVKLKIDRIKPIQADHPAKKTKDKPISKGNVKNKRPINK